MEIKSEKVEIKEAKRQDRFESMFDSLVTKNYITKDITVGDIKFSLKPLNTEEYLDAETIYIASLNGVPQDVISRARTVSTLAHSLVSLNDIPILDGNETDDESREIRFDLRKLLMKLPPTIIDKVFAEYLGVVSEQTKLYDDLVNNIENF